MGFLAFPWRARIYRRLKQVPVAQLTCMQSYPHEQSPFLVAAGTLHGRVQIINFKVRVHFDHYTFNNK